MDAQSAGNLINGFDIQDDFSVFILGEGGFILANDFRQLVQGHVAGLAKVTDAVTNFAADFSHEAASCFLKINFSLRLFLFPGFTTAVYHV